MNDKEAALDRMLDDLKTTIGSDGEMSGHDHRGDSSLVSSFRNSSYNDRPDSFVEIFRSSSRSGSRSGSRAGHVEDGGHVKHTHHEYHTPDNQTHVVTEKYEYDTGDSSKSKHYQKKVMKSTYSNYDSMSAGSLEDPPPRELPQISPPAPVDTKVITASQKVANKLVDALATIGGDGSHVPAPDSSDTDTLRTDTMRTTTTVTSEYSTLGRLRKNINELDSLIYSLEDEDSQTTKATAPRNVPIELPESKPPVVVVQVSPPEKQKTQLSPSSNTDEAMESSSSTTVTSTKRTVEYNTSDKEQHKILKEDRSTGTLSNGMPTSKYEVDSMIADDHKPAEVRRIVWRNRFEKTYETNDSSQPTPSQQMTIEEESRRREQLQRRTTSTSTTSTSTLSSPPQRGPVSPRLPQLQCAVVWPGYGAPPNVSPGGTSWKEPIPMPTPPQLSPREPGVAYIYSYAGQQGGTGVQPLPPLNYVNVPGAQSVPPSEGAPSPTPSSQLSQPIIYHYSYHYTIQPGQQPPDGAPLPPGGTLPLMQAPPSTCTSNHTHTQMSHHTHTTTECNHPGQPCHPGLPCHPSHHGKPTQPGHHGHPGQPCHPGHPCHPSHHGKLTQPGHPDHPGQPGHPGHPGQPSTINYNIHSHTSRSTTSNVNRSETTSTLDYPTGPRPKDGPHGHDPHSPSDDPGYPRKPVVPVRSHSPSSPDSPTDPGQPGGPKGAINITINKTTTTRTIHGGGYPDGTDVPPVTSTPYSSRGRSISPEPRTPNSHHITYHTHINRTSHSDSLDRVRRPRDETLPFPNTTPIKSSDNGKIPRRVDDLMTSFSDSEDGGPHGGPHNRTPRRPDPADHEPLLPRNNQVGVRADADAKAAAATEAELKREATKNKAGLPVYYPPGHELFHETMHTMTLKEGGRRGKAKWRAERSAGYKESASSSESKGGVAMVPVCLPLCCGAACVIM